MKTLAFVDGDNAILANAFHGVCEQVADGSIIVRSDTRYVCHFRLVFDLDRHFAKLFSNVGHCRFDTALHLNWVDARYNSLEALVENGFSHYGCRRRTVTSHVTRLGGYFANHSRTHVFVHVFQVDFLGNRNSVFRDCRATKAFLENNVTPARSKRDLNSPR